MSAEEDVRLVRVEQIRSVLLRARSEFAWHDAHGALYDLARLEARLAEAERKHQAAEEDFLNARLMYEALVREKQAAEARLARLERIEQAARDFWINESQQRHGKRWYALQDALAASEEGAEK